MKFKSDITKKANSPLEYKRLLCNLLQNAFDFSKQSIHDFDKLPQYSVINFYAAIELFFKARLMREHWSLVVLNTEKADIHKFIVGDFQSVSLEKSIERLKNIVEENISKSAGDCFNSLRMHRNMMVHFFHPSLREDNRSKIAIASEQCRAWFYLKQILESWSYIFIDYEQYNRTIQEYDDSIKKHKIFLETKYKEIMPVLEEMGNQNILIARCPFCSFNALLQDDAPDCSCMVCDSHPVGVTIMCPHCRQNILITDSHDQCTACSYLLKPQDIEEFLDSPAMAHCPDCESEDSVVIMGEEAYLCLNCFTIYDEVNSCDYCGQDIAGEMLEASGYFGCSFCGGSKEQYRD